MGNIYNINKKLKQIAKVLTLVFVFAFTKSWGQVFIIDENFNGGTTPGAGWVYAGTITSSSGTGNYGRIGPNLTIAGASPAITYSWTGGANNPDLVSFLYRNVGGSIANCAASSLLVEESTNGAAWTTVSGTTLKIQSSITSQFKGMLLSTTRYVRVSFTPVGGISCTFDDFKIRKAGNCTSDPKINMVLINGGCTAGCEGGNEVVFAQNGNTALSISDLSLYIQGAGTTGGTVVSGTNTANSTIIWTKNSSYNATQLSYITALTGTCSAGTFIPLPAGDVIPPNARMLLYLGQNASGVPTATYNFNTICGLGPFYVTFATYDCVGKLSNSGCTQCFRTITLMNNATGCVDTQTYTSISSGAAGTSIVFDPISGSPSETQTTCNNFTILPLELIDFYATKEDKQNDIVWKVAEETNVESYMIEKSEDGINFSLLENKALNHNKTDQASIKTYSVVDENPFEDYTYYRLGTKGKDGSIQYHKIISVDEKSTDWGTNHYQKEENLVIDFKNSVPKNSNVSLFDLSGKLLAEKEVKDARTTIGTQELAEGLYFIKVQSPYKTENFKIIIQK